MSEETKVTPDEEVVETVTSEDEVIETDAAEENAAAADASTDEAEEGEEKLSRKDKKALEKKDQEIAELKDRYMRTMAEYENFRKRTEREKADIYTYAVKDAMTKILPVVDNLERGLEAIPEDQKADPFAEGLEKIYQQTLKALEDIGVKAMDAEGKPFDPAMHQAVMHIDDPSMDKNVVAKELMKGYTYKEAVIRHAMVTVAN